MRTTHKNKEPNEILGSNTGFWVNIRATRDNRDYSSGGCSEITALTCKKHTSGPSEKKRRMYVAAVDSIIPYAAPAWANEINNKKKRTLVNKLHGLEAIRVIGAYRTVSYDAATILAGICPIDVIAKSYYRRYNGIKGTTERNGRVTVASRNEIKNNAADWAIDEWKKRIEDMRLTGGTSVRETLMPVFDIWLERKGMPLCYEITRIITGHGCFDRYLWRFERGGSASCTFRNDAREDNVHVLVDCPEWTRQRTELDDKLQITEMNLRNVIEAAIRNEDGWAALRSFCKRIVTEKIGME